MPCFNEDTAGANFCVGVDAIALASSQLLHRLRNRRLGKTLQNDKNSKAQ
jgi:hypothetical protein